MLAAENPPDCCAASNAGRAGTAGVEGTSGVGSASRSIYGLVPVTRASGRPSERRSPARARGPRQLAVVRVGRGSELARVERRGQELLGGEGLVEVVAAREVFLPVLGGLPHEAALDERPDHVAEVLGALDAPVLEDHERERSEGVDREAPDPVQELAPAHVALLADDARRRVLEGLVDEDVSLEREAAVLADELPDLLELAFLGLCQSMLLVLADEVDLTAGRR